MPNPFDDYWKFRVQSAMARLDAAREVIHHNLTRGSVGEAALRSVLHDYLTSRWNVGTGFLTDADGNRSSQVDVLVYDLLSSLPLYRDDDVVIVPPASVNAAFEVKTTLDGDRLNEAILNTKSIKSLNSNISVGVFAYFGQAPDTTKTHLLRYLNEAAPEFVPWHLLPDTIYIMDANLLYSRLPDAHENWFSVHKPEHPVIRFVITQMLAALNVTNLQPFMTDQPFGDPVLTV